MSRNSDFSSRFHQQVFVLFDHITPPQTLTMNNLLLRQDALLNLEYFDISGNTSILFIPVLSKFDNYLKQVVKALMLIP